MAEFATGSACRGPDRKKIKIQLEGEDDNDSTSMCKHIINTYSQVPNFSFSLGALESYAIERLALLMLIEGYNKGRSAKNYSNEYFYELKQSIPDHLKTYHGMLVKKPGVLTATDQLELMKIDHVSHYLLCMAFSKSTQQSHWFISLETDLFRLKLYSARKWKCDDELLDALNIPFDKVSVDELLAFESSLRNSRAPFLTADMLITNQSYYKIHFTNALELVRQRGVFLHNGYAFVHSSSLGSVLAQKFRKTLTIHMTGLGKLACKIREDVRLSVVFAAVHRLHVNRIRSDRRLSSMSLSDLELSVRSFPLCMQSLYDSLKSGTSLKYSGRLQLGLFLSELGLSINDAISLFRGNTAKLCGMDKLRTDDEYNLRHMYGLEGKRVRKPAYDCHHIISLSVGPRDNHGCPFKEWDERLLNCKLQSIGLQGADIEDIVQDSKNMRFQSACHKLFECNSKRRLVGGIVTHPNVYFDKSIGNGSHPCEDVLHVDGDGVKTIESLFFEVNESTTNPSTDDMFAKFSNITY